MRGKRIIITGASSGLGAGLARELAFRGAHLGLLARREAELRILIGELQSRHPEQSFSFEAVDVCDEDRLELAMVRLMERMSGLDVAIANSGIGESRSAFSSRQWEMSREILSVNLLGAVHTLELAKTYWVKNKMPGMLVGISSVASARGLPGVAAYSASKAGLSTYLEAVRGELSGGGIRVVSIHPGFIRTGMTSGNKRMPWLLEVDDAARRIARAIEMGKSRYVFPFPMRILFTAMKHTPDSLYDWLLKRPRLYARKPGQTS